VLLFGIATSVELFHGRLSRAASRCLHGAQFDVEQTSSLLERIFQTAVGAAEAPLRLSTSVVSSLMDRQQDHSQSVQSFIAALKVPSPPPSSPFGFNLFQYIYMCHFYENALSILSDNRESPSSLNELLQPEHFQAIRTLPSYRNLLEKMIDSGNLTRARDLLEEDNTLLLEEIWLSLTRRKSDIRRLIRAMHLLSVASSQPISQIELYMTTFEGQISESGYLRNILDSIKRMTPEELVVFIQTIYDTIQGNSRDTDVDERIEDDSVIAAAILEISTQISKVLKEAQESGKSVRSSYVIHSKGLRTTVIAQRVQLSYENSTLSDQDKAFTILVDRLSDTLVDYFTLPNPQDMFLNETWLYDTTIRHRSVFQPRPRAAIERALSAPYDYINCTCCESVEGLSSTHPATAILYQMYLETGSLINIYDLWSAFFEMLSGGEEHQVDERDALVLFYRALADLKSLGMVKQSKKKTDHLAKVAWKGL
jgi:origin recognition complex subunit 3